MAKTRIAKNAVNSKDAMRSVQLNNNKQHFAIDHNAKKNKNQKATFNLDKLNATLQNK